MFDKDGMRLESYSLFNLQNGKYIEVMNLKFDVETKKEIAKFIKGVKIIWPGNSTKTPSDTVRLDEGS